MIRSLSKNTRKTNKNKINIFLEKLKRLSHIFNMRIKVGRALYIYGAAYNILRR